MTDKDILIEKANKILKLNDLGGYTVPTHGLYPFQWNWDAAITALGWMKTDEARAWQEIHMLLKGQWENGMVPHIIFHKEVDSYFPGADVWGVDRELRTTAISQPPVLASVVKMMFEQATDKELAQENINQILEKLINYHLWWYTERDPKSTGLVVSYHPWESGMDNSPAWDKSLAAVPPVSWTYKRRDLEHVDSAERPHADEYDRYLYLVDFFKSNNFDSEKIYKDCPYKMFDIGIISILHKATKDLIALCSETEHASQGIAQLNAKVTLTESSIAQLWSEDHHSFLNKDAITNEFCPVLTTGTMMALYGELANESQASQLQTLLKDWLKVTNYGVSSTYAKCAEFEPQRYWRGPVWLHINWLLALGTDAYGFTEETKLIQESALKLIQKEGFYEYFNCDTGAGCGGDAFSWTAAISLHWLL
jgi:glycogen debranching enzyme